MSRRFARETETALAELMSRDLSQLDIGQIIAEHCMIGALGITAYGTKILIGLAEEAAGNASAVKALLGDLAARGLCAEGGLLAVVDGSKALTAGLNAVFGDQVLIQRCPNCTSGATFSIICQSPCGREWAGSWLASSLIPIQIAAREPPMT